MGGRWWTGPTTSRPALLEGLRAAGVAPGEVARVFVTHIHLDHAGGLGALAEALPRARLYAHSDGVPHLVDPSRLIASARRAWGAAADPLWGPILPVPADRLTPLSGGERFPLHEGVLEVLATPGHARHHLSFVDTARHALMTGDSAGVRLGPRDRARPAIPRPTSTWRRCSPAWSAWRPPSPRSCGTPTSAPLRGEPGVFGAYRAAVERWRDVALATAKEHPTMGAVAAALRDLELGSGGPASAASVASDPGALVSSFEMAAQGLLRYFQGHGLLQREGP